jgi:hypothetical protein
MSFLGSKEDAKKWAEQADMQIDSLMTTSPVRDGGTEAGAAPMTGTSEFTQARTRPGIHDSQKSVRREFPSEGVGSKSGV